QGPPNVTPDRQPLESGETHRQDAPPAYPNAAGAPTQDEQSGSRLETVRCRPGNGPVVGRPIEAFDLPHIRRDPRRPDLGYGVDRESRTEFAFVTLQVAVDANEVGVERRNQQLEHQLHSEVVAYAFDPRDLRHLESTIGLGVP